MKFIGETTMTIILIAAGSVVNAFVIMKLWNWLLVPSFEIEPIGMAVGLAVSIVKGYFLLRMPEATNDKPYWDNMLRSFVFLIIMALMFLLTGWVASLFL